MSESDEIAALRQEICKLRERIAQLECDIGVLTLENEALDKLRRQDAIRLAARGLLD
jgi:hypothetical protein